jgi:hypothetical protein
LGLNFRFEFGTRHMHIYKEPSKGR